MKVCFNKKGVCDFNLAGTQSEFIINNTKAGPGALAVTIEGPSKVKMDCQEVPEGYKVQYTPMAPGNYLISIKYGGPNHITGSPFKAKVTGKVVNVTLLNSIFIQGSCFYIVTFFSLSCSVKRFKGHHKKVSPSLPSQVLGWCT